MKERYKRKQLPALLGILMTIGLVALVLLLHGVFTAINTVLEISFMEYIEYLLIIVFGIFLVRKWLTEYEYTLTEEELLVDRYIGSRPRRIFECRLGQIIYIGKDAPKDCKGAKSRLTFMSGKKGVTYITYIKNDEKRCAVFSPSDEFAEKLKDRIVK